MQTIKQASYIPIINIVPHTPGDTGSDVIVPHTSGDTGSDVLC